RARRGPHADARHLPRGGEQRGGDERVSRQGGMSNPFPPPAEILRATGLHAGYGTGDIIKGVDAALGQGAIVTIIGPNGSGKSTLIKTLAGLLPARQGEIELEGQRLNDLSAPKRVRAGIAYVPQEYNVFRNLTVLENLKIARGALGVSHTCIVLAGGRVRAVAPANEVLGMKDLNSLYLGDATLH